MHAWPQTSNCMILALGPMLNKPQHSPLICFFYQRKVNERHRPYLLTTSSLHDSNWFGTLNYNGCKFLRTLDCICSSLAKCTNGSAFCTRECQYLRRTPSARTCVSVSARFYTACDGSSVPGAFLASVDHLDWLFFYYETKKVSIAIFYWKH